MMVFDFRLISEIEQDIAQSLATADLISGALAVSDCAALPCNNGRLLYVKGCKLTTDHLGDELPDFLPQFFPDGFMAIEVSWTVEMMQWHKVCDGGDCVDEVDWIPYVGKPMDHSNVGQFPTNIPQHGQRSARVNDTYLSSTVGDATNSFVLNEDLITQLPIFHPALKAGFGRSGLTWADQHYSGELKANQVQVHDNVLVTGSSLGDVKITITAKGCEASLRCFANVVAVQTQGISGITFKPYAPQPYYQHGHETVPLERVDYGDPETKQEFIKIYRIEITVLAWFLRLVSVGVMGLAWQCMCSPLYAVAKGCDRGVLCASSCASLVCFSVGLLFAWWADYPSMGKLVTVVLVVVAAGLCTECFLSLSETVADARSVATPYVMLRHVTELDLPAAV